MADLKLTVAVTGLNATDNPGPGVTVIRAIRQDPDFKGRIVGLAYDSLDPGIYARDLVDDVFLLPYPSQGIEALKQRLEYIHERVGLEVILPTLDSELPSFFALEDHLRGLGIGTFLCRESQYDLRAKDRLADMGKKAGIPVPATKVITDASALYSIHEEIPYPFFVKGLYYGATLARSVDEAIPAFHHVVAKWGLPVIIQQAVEGEELDVVAVGDGKGGLVGAVPMKKTFVTDKGKGWAGITIKDPDLLDLTKRFIKHLQWKGPCEVEVIKDRKGGYHLLEINPRFPAWTFLSAGAGQNLPAAVVRLAAGLEVAPMTEYRAGTMFVRIAMDQITDLADFQQIASTGEILRGENKHD
jgi:carbamoyl-phosphate synthase large subunit